MYISLSIYVYIYIYTYVYTHIDTVADVVKCLSLDPRTARARDGESSQHHLGGTNIYVYIYIYI